MVDYLGFRVICMSVLPVDRDTLKYGTNDDCKNVHNSDENLDALIQKNSTST